MNRRSVVLALVGTAGLATAALTVLPQYKVDVERAIPAGAGPAAAFDAQFARDMAAAYDLSKNPTDRAIADAYEALADRQEGTTPPTTTLAPATTLAPTTTTTLAPSTTTTLAPSTTTSTSTTTTLAPTTTEAPTTTTVAPTTSCVGVAVTPRSDLQPVMDANPAGSTFCLSAGTYSLTRQLVPKNGSKIIGAPGTILRAASPTVPWGIMGWAGVTYDVTVRGLIIERFVVNLKAGERWTVEDNEFRYAATIGMQVNTGGIFRRNHSHHNGQYGMTGGRALVESNEVNDNNKPVEGCALCGTYDGGGDAGGSKFVKSDGLVLRGNYVHHNNGPGLWCDGDCIRTTYDANRIEFNVGPGILHEICFEATISNNVLRSNASAITGKSTAWGGEITINASSDVDVFGNEVFANTNGIALVDYGRGTSTAYSRPYVAQHVHVHDNTVTMLAGSLYAAGASGSNPLLFSAEGDNTFTANTYVVPTTTGAFWVWGSPKTLAQWTALGFDVL